MAARKPATPSGAAPITTASGTRLVHPEEDISLEERRAKFAKYQKRQQPPPSQAPPFGAGPHGGYGAPPVMYQAAPMISRPPLMMNHPPRPGGRY